MSPRVDRLRCFKSLKQAAGFRKRAFVACQMKARECEEEVLIGEAALSAISRELVLVKPGGAVSRNLDSTARALHIMPYTGIIDPL